MKEDKCTSCGVRLNTSNPLVLINYINTLKCERCYKIRKNNKLDF